jgi:hypothetical protein
MNRTSDQKDEFVLKPCIVTMMDVLGSSDLLKNSTEEQKSRYLRNLQNMFLTAGKYYSSDQIKTFSDNILIHDNDNDDNLSKMINSIAQMQFQSVSNLGLVLRGAVASGGLYRSNIGSDFDDFTIGDSLVTAHELESNLAKTPRIIVQEELAKRFMDGNDDDCLLRRQGEECYIDYLQTAITDGFPDGEKLDVHRNALIDRIRRNNNNIKQEKWDAIRMKDVWCLSYHNDFCSRYDAEEFRIDFTEAFDREGSRIEIIIEEEKT